MSKKPLKPPTPATLAPKTTVADPDAPMEKYVPADSSTYLEGSLPQYQSGDDWDLDDGEDPVDLGSLSNLMDPS